MTDNHGFELIREQQIPEIKTRARLYRHIKTGAELLSLENDDENKVFGITFRTPPPDSTGVAHIMEHSVLCGSRKYPVKEPFVELVKGSLNTFLNAMTFSDKTAYPVASQNVQDFYNLIDVYLDAVFFPNLSPYTLMQEGWHYELEDPNAPMTFKGVVFNEMKGAYSEPEGVLSEQIQYSLFPDTIYNRDSGGNPAAIPDLTFEGFRGFHDNFYHPSNAKIYFYGDDDPEKRLAIINEYLCQFERRPVDSSIGVQQPYADPRRVVAPYEISDGQEDAKSYVTVNWLLSETGDVEMLFGLSMLDYILTGTPAAQLRKALIDSGLGEDLTGRGLETSMIQYFYSIGLKGVKTEDVDKVEKLIFDTLSELAIKGVDKENIAAALNTFEFHLRENNTGSFPRGLSIMLRALDFWLYDKDPLAPLAFEAPIKQIKERLQAGEPYFEHLIEGFLINNTHRSTVILNPDPELSEKRAAAERERLDKAHAGMDDTQIQAVIDTTKELKRRQETPDPVEALMTIPMLKRVDLDRDIRHIPTEVIESSPSTVLYHDLFTNGIVYLDLGFNMRVLPQEVLPYISLFSRALTEMGTQKESFVQLLQRIGRTTGGIHASSMTSAVRYTDRTVSMLFLRGKAMVDQAGDLLGILHDIITSINLDDRERFRQMALEEKAGMESSVVNNGHRFVLRRVSAHFNPAEWVSEQMGGISYLFFLRDLVQKIDNDWPGVLKTLQAIQHTLLNGSSALCNVTLDAANWQKIQPQINDFLSGLPVGKAQEQPWNVPQLPASEGLTIPSQVNYVGKGANLFALGYKLNGSTFVVNKYLNGTWMWEKIRVLGGAYGGYSLFDSQSGTFNFLSYRDPNILSSLQTYDQTANFLHTLEIDESELDKAVIGTIGDMDTYLLPDAKGYTAMRWYLLGTTDEERQRIRNEVLNTSAEDFIHFGATLEKMKDHSAVVVLGAEDAIQAAGIFDEVKKVL